MSPLTQTSAWRALQAHADMLEDATLRGLFSADPARSQRMRVPGPGLELDFSRHKVTGETLQLLGRLAAQQDWAGWRDRMYAGERINTTEDRAALHVALRRGADAPVEVREALESMRRISELLRSGQRRGATGKSIAHVVHIGVGGSDLGPRLAVNALERFRDTALGFDFVANIDPTEMDRVLARSDPERTLFVSASKSFTTQETLVNSQAAHDWLRSRLPAGTDAGRHFIAVTGNLQAARDFGIASEDVLPVWDWAGGRFSLWSPVGLTVMLAVGAERFTEFLAGAAEIDAHFATAPFEANVPALMALLGVWHTNFQGAQTHAVLPYAQSLAQLPAYLQQLEMESNGKSVDRAGAPVDYATAPVLWGAAGTVGQHSFHQLLHQGTVKVPADFIVLRESAGDPARHRVLVANAIAQAEALALGRHDSDLKPWRLYPGDRSSSMITLERLDPRNLGRLLALYEHKVFMQGCIWNINSFDQWGVEYGKQLAAGILARLDRNPDSKE
jgi:glucose-6-phosphate isomerase